MIEALLATGRGAAVTALRLLSVCRVHVGWWFCGLVAAATLHAGVWQGLKPWAEAATPVRPTGPTAHSTGHGHRGLW